MHIICTMDYYKYIFTGLWHSDNVCYPALANRYRSGSELFHEESFWGILKWLVLQY
jgi:hypothetical protein